MTYIDYLNCFSAWVDENRPGDKTIILYYAILALFNKRRWPNVVGIDTPHIMLMANTTNRNTALRARDELVEAGFIEYKQGKKGQVSEYRLLEIKSSTQFGIKSDTQTEKGTICGINIDTQYDTETGKDTECGTENGTQFGIKSDTPIEDIRYKKKYNINNVNVIARSQTGLGRVFTYYMDNINDRMTEKCADDMKYYFSVMGEECLIRAIDAAIDVGAKWPYIKKILSDKAKQGVRCIADWDRSEQEYREKKEQERNCGNIAHSSFIPPTEEELMAYCEGTGRYIDIKAFLNHYNSVAWKKGHTQITDWRPLVPLWADMNPEYEEREKNKRKKRKGKHIAIIDGQEYSVEDDE